MNELYLENELRIHCLVEKKVFKKGITNFWKIDFEKLHHIKAYFPEEYQQLKEGRQTGKLIDVTSQHLVYSHTMIGEKRLDNIEYCLNEINEKGIEGDIIECGVWRGGATIFIKGYMDAYEMNNRQLWLADSFEGVPKSTWKQDKYSDLSKEKIPGLAVGLEEVKNNFKKYDLLDKNIRFLKGWFKDTLRKAPIDKLALLRLDGDLYESTMDALEALYDKVSIGGFVIIDDYKALPQCEEAVLDFRKKNNIISPMITIDHEAIYWVKESSLEKRI